MFNFGSRGLAAMYVEAEDVPMLHSITLTSTVVPIYWPSCFFQLTVTWKMVTALYDKMLEQPHYTIQLNPANQCYTGYWAILLSFALRWSYTHISLKPQIYTVLYLLKCLNSILNIIAFKMSSEVTASSDYNSNILFPLLCEFKNEMHHYSLTIKLQNCK
jgi:hypothetical protein